MRWIDQEKEISFYLTQKFSIFGVKKYNFYLILTKTLFLIFCILLQFYLFTIFTFLKFSTVQKLLQNSLKLKHQEEKSMFNVSFFYPQHSSNTFISAQSGYNIKRWKMIFKYKGSCSNSWESTEGGNFFRYLMLENRKKKAKRFSFLHLKIRQSSKVEREAEKKTRNEFHIEIK